MLADGFPEVLAAAKVGAEWAWRLLHEELSAPLLRFARARGAHDPENVVGDVFLDLARRLQTFEGSLAALRGLAFMMASHRVIDEHRRRRRRPEELIDQLSPYGGTSMGADEAAENRGTAARAEEMIRLLSPDQQEVLLLRLIGDLSLEEVAQVTGRSLTGVKALQRRGLATLRRTMLSQAVSR